MGTPNTVSILSVSTRLQSSLTMVKNKSPMLGLLRVPFPKVLHIGNFLFVLYSKYANFHGRIFNCVKIKVSLLFSIFSDKKYFGRRLWSLAR